MVGARIDVASTPVDKDFLIFPRLFFEMTVLRRPPTSATDQDHLHE
jgi:hypothetical protein